MSFTITKYLIILISCSDFHVIIIRLGSGWSFYTNRAWKKEPIKDDEISIIKEQIKKAEVSRNKEEYRIG